MKPKQLIQLTLILLLLIKSTGASAHSETLKPLPLPEIVRQTLAFHFDHKTQSPQSPKSQLTLDQFIQSFAVPSHFQHPAGVFVTLSIHDKSRACWGSIYPEHANVVVSTVYSTLDALTKDYRYKPITHVEYPSLKPQVTVIRAITPIHNLSSVDPFHDGLMVRSGGKSGIILPGETKDAYYQLVACKLKAGIQPKEHCQIYMLKADIYE